MTITRRDVLQAAMALSTAGLPIAFENADAKTGGPKPWQLPEKNAVEVTENEWIPLKDGTRLGARLWLPAGATAKPVPVVWEYIPYRKRDLMRQWDDAWGQVLAQYGVAFARVDVRGSGDSEGVLVDEYLEQELDDGVEVIAWLARQPWSNGNVGMRGISWGGINTLEVAAKAPPALKAIMPMCCTDTRFTDDAHYIGGALGLTNFQWGMSFKSVMAGPPDPEIAGPAWRELWHDRLRATPDIIARWLSHQRNDSYWQHGSVSTDFSRIKCPVYIVDGWVDTYVNTVSRVLAGVKTPRKALVGPWGHNAPQGASPGPGLDWPYEEVRWWKHWLSNSATGIMDEPMFRVYMPYTTASETYPKETPGRWVAETNWPAPAIKQRTWYLDEKRLTTKPKSQSTVVYVADKVVGLQKPEWLPFPPEGLPGEQTPDDRKSLVFDSEPLTADLEILGHPVARIRVASNRRVAKLALRLCEVTPEGKSWLVTYGLLNLTHRDGHEQPAALTPGQFYDVAIDLSLIAHRFKAGHRIRLSVSESLWPLVWPSPEVVTLSLVHGASSLELPVRPQVLDPSLTVPVLHGAGNEIGLLFGALKMSGPDADGWYEMHEDPDDISYPIPGIGTTLTGGFGRKETLRIRGGDNNSCTWESEHTGGFKRGDWDCSIYSGYRLSSTLDSFFVEETIRAWDGKTLIFERVNKVLVKRDLM